MKLSPFATMVPQSTLGIVRHRLYTLKEASEELKVSVMRMARACNKCGTKPSFNTRPFKYTLNDIKLALSREDESLDYVIEKAVPVPPTHGKYLAAEIEAVLRKMEVGDSIVATVSEVLVFYRVAKELGLPIVTRKTEDPTKRRLWRVQG